MDAAFQFSEFDKAAVIKACTSLLEQAEADQASVERRAQIIKIRGIALHMSGNVDAAVQEFKKALELTPKDTDLLVRLGLIVLTRREFDISWLDEKAYTKAVDFAQQALAIDPNDLGATF